MARKQYKSFFRVARTPMTLSCKFAPIRGHTGGEVIAPELMGHVGIPLKWKEFLYHRGRSFSVKSILQARHIEGGKERNEGRQTVFFTPLELCGPKQKKNSTMTNRGKEKLHFNRTWKFHQDAVYRIHLAKTQEN